MDLSVIEMRATHTLRDGTQSAIPAHAGIHLYRTTRPLFERGGSSSRAMSFGLFVILGSTRNLQFRPPSDVFLCKGSRFLTSFGMTEVRLAL